MFTNAGCPVDIIKGNHAVPGESVVVQLPRSTEPGTVAEVYDTHSVISINNGEVLARLYFKIDDCPDKPVLS